MIFKNDQPLEVAKVEPPGQPAIAFGQGGIQLRTLDEAFRFCQVLVKTAFAPRGSTPEGLLIAIQYGAEVGLSPMQAIQNVSVINGKPSVYGDAFVALCQRHPDYGRVEEAWGGAGDDFGVTVRAYRKSSETPAGECTFTISHAKRAGLWGKSGPWTQYPERMLQWRARGFALRDAFADALKGLISQEEAQDYPANGTGKVIPPASSFQRPAPQASLRPAPEPMVRYSIIEAQPHKETRPLTPDHPRADSRPPPTITGDQPPPAEVIEARQEEAQAQQQGEILPPTEPRAPAREPGDDTLSELIEELRQLYKQAKPLGIKWSAHVNYDPHKVGEKVLRLSISSLKHAIADARLARENKT